MLRGRSASRAALAAAANAPVPSAASTSMAASGRTFSSLGTASCACGWKRLLGTRASRSSGVTGGVALFLGLIVLSRFGLYGFDVGLLQLEQLAVDEKHRGEV